MMLTFRDQQTPDANQRINNSYQFDESFSWFLPEKWGGDHDMKFGVQYIFADARINDETNANGTFVFSTDAAFDPANPRTYPERLQILVPSPESTYMKSQVFVGFAQDKYQRGNLTLNFGLRYDLEVIPLDNDSTRSWRPGTTRWTRTTSRRASASPTTRAARGRSVVRGGYGLFYDKMHLTIIDEFLRRGVYASTFTASFPNDRADPGPSSGRLPTDPFLVNGPVVNRALLAQQFPAGVARPQHRRRLPRHAGPPRAVHAPGHHRLPAPARQRMSASVDYIKTWARDMLIY